MLNDAKKVRKLRNAKNSVTPECDLAIFCSYVLYVYVEYWVHDSNTFKMTCVKSNW